MSSTHTIERLDRRFGQGLNHPPTVMKKNALLSIARPLGCRIDCLEGTLWITQDGDPHDTLLSAGTPYRPQPTAPDRAGAGGRHRAHC
jgi:hypothetical protein